MNYRHVYHAGNFADVVKHLLLVLCLDHLRKKAAPFFVLDAQGGCGLYNLNSTEAQKTREYEPGIGALMKAQLKNADANLYLDAVREDFQSMHYPGSPLIAARLLRAQDRMIANELHPDDVSVLEDTLWAYKNNVRVEMQDAYQGVRAHVPPAEKRGLVLIDPPYEIGNNEHDIIIRQMREWKKRWPTGTYIIWYPVKDNFPSSALHDAATELGLNRTWMCEHHDANLPPLPNSDRGDRKRMRSTGLIVFNTPYMVPERMEAAMAELAPLIGGKTRTGWLTAA